MNEKRTGSFLMACTRCIWFIIAVSAITYMLSTRVTEIVIKDYAADDYGQAARMAGIGFIVMLVTMKLPIHFTFNGRNVKIRRKAFYSIATIPFLCGTIAMRLRIEEGIAPAFLSITALAAAWVGAVVIGLLWLFPMQACPGNV